MVDITELIHQARDGDRSASEQLFAHVYDDLRHIAARQLGRARGDMRVTSLVHEAYFRLARPDALRMNDRAHFYAIAARAMRQLVIDHARQRIAGKRGGGEVAVELDSQIAMQGRDEELLALDQALEQLAEVEPDLARMVELRFFAGMELSEITDITSRSERSLKRDWRRARAFLHARLSTDAVLPE